MDIFKQNRNLKIAVIILTVLNILALTFLWLGRPKNHPPENFVRNPVEDNNRVKVLLQDELGFDENQAHKYLELRKNLKMSVDKLEGEIRIIKKQMFDEALKEGANIAISDSLLNLAQSKQAEIERLTFQHFVNLKNLCRSDQKDKLQNLIHKLFQPKPEAYIPPRLSPPRLNE